MSNAALRWLLYGAYGYTGKLVIEQALARGHKPVLAGRDARQLQPLAEAHGLEWRACALDDTAGLRRLLADVDLAYHVAGPFTQTAAPLREACIATRTHYVDVTGESPVTAETFAQDARARQAGVLLLPSSGVNAVPADCIAAFVHGKLADADTLEVAIDTVHRQSSGSLVSMVEVASLGGQVRRDGRIEAAPMGAHTRRIDLPIGTRHAMALPLSDLHTVWHTTGVPNITAYVVQQRAAILGARLAAPLMQRVFRSRRVRDLVQTQLRRHVQGPDETARAGDHTWAWARASNARGEAVEACLQTLEGYTFTGAVAPLVVEAALASGATGATTAARAFGADFILGVAGTRRFPRT